jgi:hypothetical protein
MAQNCYSTKSTSVQTSVVSAEVVRPCSSRWLSEAVKNQYLLIQTDQGPDAPLSLYAVVWAMLVSSEMAA